MTEDEARSWIESRDVPRETIAALELFAKLLVDGAAQQNLVSSASLEHVWSRHFVDSMQLSDHAPRVGDWADLGSGAGFPGLIIALTSDRPVTLMEPRAKRAAFLREAADALGLHDRVEIVQSPVERVDGRTFDVISARAFAPLPRLFGLAWNLSSAATCWLLPKGRSAQKELDEVRPSWLGDFRTVPSITDRSASIIIASNVQPRRAR